MSDLINLLTGDIDLLRNRFLLILQVMDLLKRPPEFAKPESRPVLLTLKIIRQNIEPIIDSGTLIEPL